MLEISILILALALGGCSSKPSCEVSNAAHAVFSTGETCRVRIRQILIGSEMQLPQGYKREDLQSLTLDWKEAEIKNGVLELAHFYLSQGLKQ